MTKTFKEECIIRNLWTCEEEKLGLDKTIKNIDLRDESLKLFMRNNFESTIDTSISKSYLDDNVFNLNGDDETETVVDISENTDQYDLTAYIKINSNLIADINNLEKQMKTLSPDQKEVIDYVHQNLANQMLIFLSGEGGCGKTYLINILNSMMTMNGLNVNKLATTGFAAALIEGRTLHSFFSINHLLRCTLQYDSSKWHIIKQTDVIIIDECSLMSDEIINLIDEVLSRMYYDDKNKKIIQKKFGAKTIILCGDLLQLEAVSTFNRPITQLYKSFLFRENFKPFILQTNMRAIEDKGFSKFLSDCRVGIYDFEYIKLRICGEGHAYTNECSNMFYSVNICALHKNRKEILLNTLNKYFPNQTKITINSIDTYEDGSIFSEYVTKKITESSGSLEETIILTKGCKIILIKNINIEYKISNGLEGEYIGHSEYILLMKLADGTIIPIPKLKQKIEKLTNQNIYVYRTNFPILLGYAVTVHRVQGATLKKAHLYLDNTVFCEGQAYVSLSRVRNAESIHILKFDKCAFKTNMEIVELLNYAKIFKTMKNFKIDINKNLNAECNLDDQTNICPITDSIAVIY